MLKAKRFSVADRCAGPYRVLRRVRLLFHLSYRVAAHLGDFSRYPFSHRMAMNGFFRLPIRTRIGIASAVLLVAALISYGGKLLHGAHWQPSGGLLGMGSILFLIWLAWDDLSAIPRWFWGVFPILLAIGAFRPQLLFVIVPGLFLVCFLWPRKKTRR